MNCVGIDVSKGKSTVCILRPFGEVVFYPYEVLHTNQDVKNLISVIKALDGETKVVLEATGIYHLPLVKEFLRENLFVSIINPYVMKKYSSLSLRRAKTDKLDSIKIANYGIDNWLSLQKTELNGNSYEQLKLLGRQYAHYIKVSVTSRQALITITDRCMPGIKNVIFSKKADNPTKDKLCDFIEKYWHYDTITKMSENKFCTDYITWAKKKGYRPNETQAKKIYAVASSGIPSISSNNAVFDFHTSEKMEEYLVTDSNTVFRCMLIKWEGINSGNVPEMVTTFNEFIQKQLKHLGQVKTVKLGEGIIGVVLSDRSDSSDEKIKNMMQKLYTDIIGGTKASLTIFISSKYYGMNDFIEKAPMLLKMQDITFFHKEKHIIFDSIYEQFSNTIPYPIQTEQKALEALSNSENDKYKEQIDRFVNRIKQTTPFVAKCYLSIFATNVVNYTKITNKAISEDIISMVEISENLDKTAEIFKNVVTDVKLATAERDEKFCDNVIDFIEKNYNNYDFCVSDLSDYLGVSASYAGKKFRNKFGQSFNNYLSELRIEKAAELLTTSDIKIGKIGEMCGFRTDAYFVTIFKKIKKMSPQEYRKLYSER